MKKHGLLVCSLLLCFALLFAGCQSTISGDGSAAAPSTQSGNDSLSGELSFNGSTSMQDSVTALAEKFTEKNADVTFRLEPTGSGAAPTAVNDGVALIGNMSRALKDSDNPGDFTSRTIALDGIAVVVHPDNAVADLTLDQIKAIFTGEVTNWKDVGGADASITVIGREEGSGTRDGFEDIVTGKGKANYAATLAETGDVAARVASDKNAVGYVSYASVSESIKAVKVGGVAVNADTIADGSYKIQRPFVQIFKKGSDNELISAWFDYVYSDEGKQVLESFHLVPVEK